uniref:acyl-CoA dehydrogenase family protein n=1 Tax=Streptomyces asoensis TaxID=249586 RepID=UPI003F5A112A
MRPPVLGGAARGHVPAVAMSEPGAGSDVAALRCRAERQPDGSRLVEGQKTWISNAHVAESMLLVARTGGDRHEGLTMFHVPMNTPGVEVGGIETMGCREVNDVFLTGVRLPADAVVGEVDSGWRQLMAALNHERLFPAANMLGLARHAFDDAVAYVRGREQFVRTVGSFQALRHRVADLATEIECARLLARPPSTAWNAICAPPSSPPSTEAPARSSATSSARATASESARPRTPRGRRSPSTAGSRSLRLRRRAIPTVEQRFAGRASPFIS